MAFTSDPQAPESNRDLTTPQSEIPKKSSLTKTPSKRPRKVSLATSVSSSAHYDDSMAHTGLQRVEGVAIRRQRNLNRSSTKNRSVSQYHGLTLRIALRNQVLKQHMGVSIPQHHGPRPSYLTQWVMGEFSEISVFFKSSFPPVQSFVCF